MVTAIISQHGVHQSVSAAWLHKYFHLIAYLYIEFIFFLKITQLPLLFWSAKALRGQAEMLPKGPQWYCKPWLIVHPTKAPIKLYYCNAIKCIEALFSNPLFANSIQYSPFCIFKTAEKLVHIYGEWMSGDIAWNLQVSYSHHFSVCIFLIGSVQLVITSWWCYTSWGYTFLR